MNAEELFVGQRVLVNVPGLGDHGQRGTIKKVRDGRCSVRLDWDQRLQHTVVFFAPDLEAVDDESTPVRSRAGDGLAEVP